MIYLDNNATTNIDSRVLETMLPYFKNSFGNPSSAYGFGKQVKEKIELARGMVAKLIGANQNEIIFTSCATESNNTAIMSAVNNSQKKHLITTKVEHSSVLATMKHLETRGYRVTYLSVDSKGRLDLNELINSISEDTLLVSVMFANNEIGNIYLIEQIGKICRNRGVLFHVDAVQAIGKIKIDVNKQYIESLSLSGHKIHGPKGIGALYMRKGVTFTPLIWGGHQENGFRGGTENVAYIVGLGKASELIIEDNYKANEVIARLRDYMEDQIKKNIDGVAVYGDMDNRLANTSSMAFEGVKGEELMFMLEADDIYVSTGSACNAHEATPSHVLVACGIDLKNSSPIRISLSRYNTKEEIEIFIKELSKIVQTLRRKRNM